MRRALVEPPDRYAALASLVALTRLPFLNLGYGTDTDAWKLAVAARAIARTGHYEASRLPGYPVQELATSFVVGGGPWAVNGLTALATVAATLLFAAVLRRLGSRDSSLAAFAFACVPAVWIASTSAMDYLWAMAFLMGALLAVQGGRSLLAGALLGCAVGCRITSCVFVAPLALMATVNSAKDPGREALRLAGAAALVGFGWYVPVMLRYGPGFLSYYEPAGGHTRSVVDFLGNLGALFHPPFSPTLIAAQGTIGVWGAVGFAALAVAIIAALVRALRPGVSREEPAMNAVPRRRYLAAWWISIALTVLLYLRLPHDEAYLIPMIPFTLLLLARGANRATFRVLCVALIASAFVLGIDTAPPKKGVTPGTRSAFARTIPLSSGEHVVIEPLRGPLLVDAAKRREMMVERAAAQRDWHALPDRAVVIAGLMLLPLQDHGPPHVVGADTSSAGPLDVRVSDLVSDAEVSAAIADGRGVFYLPDAAARTRRFFDYELDEIGAKVFPGLERLAR